MLDCEDGTETNEKGGKQSKLQERFDLMPPNALMVVAKVLKQGAKKYEPWNWLAIDVESHLNHALYHINEYLRSIRSYRDASQQMLVNYEDHLGHAACRLMMALEKECDRNGVHGSHFKDSVPETSPIEQHDLRQHDRGVGTVSRPVKVNRNSGHSSTSDRSPKRGHSKRP